MMSQLALQVSTVLPHNYDIDMKVRRCAMELEDTALLAKLASGDMIALEAKYHSKFLATLYNRTRAANNDSADSDDSDLHGIAFAELVAFMEDFRLEEKVAPSLNWLIWHNYTKPVWNSSVLLLKAAVHTSRLKLRLLSVFPDLREHKFTGKKSDAHI